VHTDVRMLTFIYINGQKHDNICCAYKSQFILSDLEANHVPTIYYISKEFDILTELTIKIMVSWNVKECSPVER
jgi:hypothetical protein